MKPYLNLLFLMLSVLFCSCGNRSSIPEDASSVPAVDYSEEAIAFAHEFERATREGDKALLEDFVDLEIILQRSFSTVDLPRGFMREARKGFAVAKTRMLNDFTSARYDLVKLVVGGDEPILRFRVRRDGTLDYLDYKVGKNADGKWMLLDAHIYSVGTKLTELLRDMVMPALEEMDKSLFERIVLRESASGAHSKSMQQIHEGMLLARKGDEESARSAIDIYHSLPREVQSTRAALLIYVMAAASLPDILEPDGEYAKALNSFERHFPNDPSSALRAIDRTLVAKEFDKSHEAITKLRAITEDDYIDFYRGYIYLHEQKYDQVEACARMWIEQEPEDMEGWELLLEAGFGSNQHAQTVEALEVLESNFGLDFSAVTSIAEWQPFCNSPEGSQWLKSRGKY